MSDNGFEDDLSQAASSATPAKATGKMPPWTPDEGDPPERYAAWLNTLWRLDAGRDPIIGAERFGKHGDAPIILIRRSGQRVRWAHQETLTRPAGLQAVLMSQCGIRPRKLTGHDTMLIAWAITQLADLRSDIDPLEEVALWWSDYANSRPQKAADPDDEMEWRAALAAWQAAARADERRSPVEAHQTFILIDRRDQTRYVRREDFARHIRLTVRGRPMSWPTLNGMLAEVGWQQSRFQHRATPSTPYVSARVYVVAADWPDLADAEKDPHDV
jgi:hypothetical protein